MRVADALLDGSGGGGLRGATAPGHLCDHRLGPRDLGARRDLYLRLEHLGMWDAEKDWVITRSETSRRARVDTCHASRSRAETV